MKKLTKKQLKDIERQAKRLKEIYESPCEEAQELIRKANESPIMSSGMTREEEIEEILRESKNY